MATMSSSRDLDLTIAIAYACSWPALVLVLFVAETILTKVLRQHQSTVKSAPKVHSIIRWAKRQVFYAPIFRQRRARQATLWNGRINFGSLPDRLQSMFIFLVLGINIFLLEWRQPFSSSSEEILDSHNRRLGFLVLANFVPIVITSTVHNPVIFLLSISYDRLLCIHRWIARMTVLEIIAHVLCHIFATGTTRGWTRVRYQLENVDFFIRGLSAAVLFVLIVLVSVKPLRSLAYDVFHYVHVVLIIAAFTLVWLHLSEVPTRWFLLTTVVLWALLRLSRASMLLYRSWSTKACLATIEPLSGDVVRVAVQSSRPWHFHPGQSLYLAIPGIDRSGAHPFSVAWANLATDTNSTVSYADDKAGVRISKSMDASSVSLEAQDVPAAARQTVFCIIKKRSGMTKKLHEHAQAILRGQAPQRREYEALIAGPYGVARSINRYRQALLVAGGVGITHQLPFVRQFLQDRLGGKLTPTHLHLIWVVPSIDVLEWIRPWMRDIENLRRTNEQASTLDLYVTRSSGTELPAEEGPFRVHPGRPNLKGAITLLSDGSSVGTSYVSVCAGGSLSDDVRSYVRKALKDGHNLDFHEEGFGW